MRVGGNWAFVHGLVFGVSLGDFLRVGENWAFVHRRNRVDASGTETTLVFDECLMGE